MSEASKRFNELPLDTRLICIASDNGLRVNQLKQHIKRIQRNARRDVTELRVLIKDIERDTRRVEKQLEEYAAGETR